MPTPEQQQVRAATKVLTDPVSFSRVVLDRPLRRYQAGIVRRLAAAVLNHDGQEYAIIMSRQAGKNEMSAHLEAYLMNRYRTLGGSIVKAAPAFIPQCINSITRLIRCLSNEWNRRQWTSRLGYIINLGHAQIMFFSAHPSAIVIGATANVLLECDEAQDVDQAKWGKDFLPMAASTNATRIYYGTTWTASTLLAQTAAALPPENVHRVDCWRVAEEVPAYGDFVNKQIKKYGAEHPIIKTQYLLQEIDDQAGMFADVMPQMHGDHPPVAAAIPGHDYVMLLDVAGESEQPAGTAAGEPRRSRQDATALTVVEIEHSMIPTMGLPAYRVVHRRRWLGTSHPALYGQLLDLAQNVWQARYLVVDATGVGAGLASFLARALGDRVIPFLFTAKTKSELGWNFLAVIQTGRFKDYTINVPDGEQAEFWQQVQRTKYVAQAGPGHVISWGAEPHDDLVISAALCAHLDTLPWRTDSYSQIIEAPDVLEQR